VKKAPPGVRVRHGSGCAARVGGRCGCQPAYEAWVWSVRDRKKVRKTFPTLAAARAWRADTQVGVRRGTIRVATPITLAEAAEAWLEGARSGSIRTRSGHLYKPSALRGYESALRARILPQLGSAKLGDIGRLDVQDMADRLLAEGLDPSTVRNTVMPLRSIFRRAVSRGEVAVNPTTMLELPALTGRRERIASPIEAANLISALPSSDRAVWATALYGGLRRGELLALRWEDIDLADGVIRVERSWDIAESRPVEPKSRAGRRSVPIASVLRDHLVEHKLASGREDGLVFGRSPAAPFDATTLVSRARSAWQGADLRPIGLHECRHTFASLMIAAGVNAKALSSYLGHASVTITYDRYGHLMPGNEREAAGLLDAYLSRADTGARLAQLE
jgi:integrase